MFRVVWQTKVVASSMTRIAGTARVGAEVAVVPPAGVAAAVLTDAATVSIRPRSAAVPIRVGLASMATALVLAVLGLLRFLWLAVPGRKAVRWSGAAASRYAAEAAFALALATPAVPAAAVVSGGAVAAAGPVLT